MATLDHLNARYSKGTMRLEAALPARPAGSRAPWQEQGQSGAFTTRLEDLLTVN